MVFEWVFPLYKRPMVSLGWLCVSCFGLNFALRLLFVVFLLPDVRWASPLTVCSSDFSGCTVLVNSAFVAYTVLHHPEAGDIGISR